MSEHLAVGRVFTPIVWASWLLEESGAYQAWLDGALICDPNFGGGAFIVALLELAKRDQIILGAENISRIFGFEININDRSKLFQSVHTRFNVHLREDSFLSVDALSSEVNQKFDVIIGNPPWVNFSVLPTEYKTKWSSLFLKYSLVKNKKNVLLGSSRTDLCALMIKKSIDINLSNGGFCTFFIPLSIFFNSGSNDLFRPYPGSEHGYAINELWDFGNEKIFEGISTRYGAVKIEKNITQTWPVTTNVRKNSKWERVLSTSSDRKQGFWQRHFSENLILQELPKIFIREGQKPRQGINTCGANDLFLLMKNGDTYINKKGENIEIEGELIYPLIDKSCFFDKTSKQRVILVPHDVRNGKPLTLHQLQAFPNAYAYLQSKRNELETRKGVMINAHIKRGLWWALLGVGPYSFSRWKVVWEALGKSAFRPIVIPGHWQGNQALHAFCPCDSEEDAINLKTALSDPSVEDYLKSSSMSGTMNWAQPGRIAKLFIVKCDQKSLFT